MTFNAATWLPLATFLETLDCAETGVAEEAVVRTAIGRAYYAAVISARDRIATQHPSIASGVGTHSAVQKALRSTKRRQLERLALLLRNMQLDREDADYRASGGGNPRPILERQLVRAKEALAMIESELAAKHLTTFPPPSKWY